MKNDYKKLKVGVIGLGKMGLLHASILNTIPTVELAALCDKSWLMRKFAKNTLKKPLVTSEVAKLADIDIDALYITTPIPSHYNIIKEVYDNITPNIFVEKTLSSSYARSQELCGLADNLKGCNMVGYMKRFSVTFRKAKELLDQEVLGSLFSFDAYAYSSDFFGVNMDSVSNARGGVLQDLGSHVVDMSLWLFGDLLSSTKITSSITSKSESVNFEVTGSHDFIGRFDISWEKEGYRMPEFGLIIHGSEGTIKVDDNSLIITLNKKQSKTFYRQNLYDHVSFYLGDSEYFCEDDYFVKSVISKGRPESNFQTAMKVDYLLDEVRGSANE